MLSIVRIKRHVEEEPLNAFVIKNKKRKIEISNEAKGNDGNFQTEDVFPVLRLAGTIQNQDDAGIPKLLRKTEAQEIIEQKGRCMNDVRRKSRLDVQKSSDENRFRVVNCMRKKLDNANDKNPEEVTIVDIEKQEDIVESDKLKNHRENIIDNDSSAAYVYDIYVNNGKELNYIDYMEDDLIRIRPFDDIVYEDCYDDDNQDDNDSEDSNDENYYGNDYPDEENQGNESDEENSLNDAVRNFVFNDDDDEEEVYSCENSSEDEDYNKYHDPYIHTVDIEDDENHMFNEKCNRKSELQGCSEDSSDIESD